MRMLKFLLCGLVLVAPVFANETDDRQTATSLKYVTHELDTRQDKLEMGANKAIEYTDSAGDVLQRTVESDLDGANDSLPTVSAVTGGLSHKQDSIEPINDHTAVTYTGQTGGISTKGIYQTSGTYAEQSDNLIDAKTFNAALKAGLDNEFVCANESQGAGAYAPSGDCWLWSIHNTYNAVAQPYVSATGTVTQDGTPTPTNPIYPTFYRQGNMVLRRVGDYADSYDATTHKITRRVGEKVLTGTDGWYDDNGASYVYCGFNNRKPGDVPVVSSHFVNSQIIKFMITNIGFRKSTLTGLGITGTTEGIIAYLAEQYAAGTPVTVWYPLAEPVEEDWPATTYGENVYIPQGQ